MATETGVNKLSKPFTLEKVLTCSIEIYCKSVGKQISDYVLKGIHLQAPEFEWVMSEEFLKKVPEGAEVVTDYKHDIFFGSNGRSCYKEEIASGIALIPKKETMKNS